MNDKSFHPGISCTTLPPSSMPLACLLRLMPSWPQVPHCLKKKEAWMGLVLFHQLACLCPIEISFRQTNTQLVQFARKNRFYRQIVGKLCIGESFLILLSLLCTDTQNFGNNKKKCRNFEKLCSEIVLFVL